MTCHNGLCGAFLRSFRNNLGTITYYCEKCDENTWNRYR